MDPEQFQREPGVVSVGLLYSPCLGCHLESGSGQGLGSECTHVNSPLLRILALSVVYRETEGDEIGEKNVSEHGSESLLRPTS